MMALRKALASAKVIRSAGRRRHRLGAFLFGHFCLPCRWATADPGALRIVIVVRRLLLLVSAIIFVDVMLFTALTPLIPATWTSSASRRSVRASSWGRSALVRSSAGSSGVSLRQARTEACGRCRAAPSRLRKPRVRRRRQCNALVAARLSRASRARSPGPGLWRGWRSQLRRNGVARSSGLLSALR